MKRVFFILASLTLLVSGVAVADDNSATRPDDAQACSNAGEITAQIEEQIADPQKSLEGQMDFQAAAAPESAAPPPPPCPTTSTCVGGANRCGNNPANCWAGGPTSAVDTGQTSCTLPSGIVGKCIFGTIHIYTTQCTQCKCCSQNPACICPLNCGQAVTFGCA